MGFWRMFARRSRLDKIINTEIIIYENGGKYWGSNFKTITEVVRTFL